MLIKGDVRFPVTIAPSRIHGKGLFAGSSIPARKKLGSLAGEIISKKEGRVRAKKKKTISMVELWNGQSLDATKSNALRYINHSCKPNTFMRTIGYHVEFYTLRAIKTNEEFTCNYGLTHHDGAYKCNCGVEGCKGYM
ncbi:MAG: SET domain-containing protein [Flavisolibacter sp.]